MKKAVPLIIVLMLFLLSKPAFAASPPPVVADGALLVDMDSGKILFERNKDTAFYPASTTKIMTALLVLERCKLSDKVIVGKKPSSFIDGSKIYIFENEELTVDQLLHALLIESANDVAIALAEHVSGTEEEFARLMTQRAKELGCKNTNFTNSHGLYEKDHYTTAYDLSLITRQAMKYEAFRNIITTEKYDIPPTNKQPETRHFYLDNRIILDTKYHVNGADGVKLGYTSEAGHSFVGTAARDNTRLMVVLLHDKKPGLWEDAKNLLEYGFSTYKTTKKVSAGEHVTNYKATGSKAQIPLVAENDFYYTYEANTNPNIVSSIKITNVLKGMIMKGQKMGYIEYSVDGSRIGEVNLLADNDMPATILYSYKKETGNKVKKAYGPWLILPAAGLLAVSMFLRLKMAETRDR
jgi:D-alanyl-D-alanine carboxypeptidase